MDLDGQSHHCVGVCLYLSAIGNPQAFRASATATYDRFVRFDFREGQPMKIFQMFPKQAAVTVRTEDQTFPEPRTSGQAPDHQRAQSPVDSEPTKADEMIRLMAERRERHKRDS